MTKRRFIAVVVLWSLVLCTLIGMDTFMRYPGTQLHALSSPIAQEDLTKQLSQLNDQVHKLKNEQGTIRKRFWLETLDPILHFRPKYWLGNTEDVEDKDQVIPHFLANFIDAADTQYKRRIYLDLGIKNFESSVCWMMQNYPVKFDFVYGFECGSDLSDLQVFNESISRCIIGTEAEKKGYQLGDVLRTFKFFYNFIGLDDDSQTSPPTRGLSQFIRDMDIAEDDFVVLKMDVEGLEYDLLDRIMEDKAYTFFDEVFVEVHYNHPEMHRWGWNSFQRSRNEAQTLFNKARDMGMYIHPWP